MLKTIMFDVCSNLSMSVAILCKAEVLWLKRQLESRFEVKTTIVGHRPDEAAEGKVLNRIVRATPSG